MYLLKKIHMETRKSEDDSENSGREKEIENEIVPHLVPGKCTY